MGIISPNLPDLDVDEWRALPRAERTKAMQQHWTQNGFGTPYAIYLLYLTKIGLYILGGLAFAASTPGIGSLGDVADWWTEPVVFQKVIVWTLLFEVLGFGCGFGPSRCASCRRSARSCTGCGRGRSGCPRGLSACRSPGARRARSSMSSSTRRCSRRRCGSSSGRLIARVTSRG